jgi:short-subunit dehydrogenase
MAFVALITGASSGIGEATARRLAREPDTRLVLVARREQRLSALADELGGATVIAADLTDPDSPGRVLEVVQREHGELHMLVNNAGASWRGRFAETGWANVERHLTLDFEAPVRLTEALLPLLRATAARTGDPVTGRTGDPAAGRAGDPATHHGRVSIVNVASTAARAARPGAGGYSAAKFALAGWTDALHAEERPHGIHVGLVLPGFVATEGFPAAELLARPTTRWLVSKPPAVAEAIVQAGPGGRAERYVPRYYWVFAALRILAPRVVRKAIAGGALTTATGSGE